MSNYMSYLTATYRVIIDKLYELFDETINTTNNRLYNDTTIYDQYTTFFSKPTHVIDNIYLGSAYNAANYSQLCELNIKVILNVTKEVSIFFPDDFIYEKIDISDNDDQDITEHLSRSYEFIDKNKDKNIFIHCKMGASRSVSVLIYYLIIKYSMTVDEALNFVKNKRIIVNPNAKFIDEIKNMI